MKKLYKIHGKEVWENLTKEDIFGQFVKVAAGSSKSYRMRIGYDNLLFPIYSTIYNTTNIVAGKNPKEHNKTANKTLLDLTNQYCTRLCDKEITISSVDEAMKFFTDRILYDRDSFFIVAGSKLKLFNLPMYRGMQVVNTDATDDVFIFYRPHWDIAIYLPTQYVSSYYDRVTKEVYYTVFDVRCFNSKGGVRICQSRKDYGH